MDLAKHLGHWKEQSPEQWVRTANRYLPPGVTAILVLAIAYQLATLTWVLVPGAAPLAVPATRAPNTPGTVEQSAKDYESLRTTHPFGEAAKEPEPVVENVADAPDTTLSLDLKGILALGEGDPNGKAIISANRGEDKTYNVGQTIDAGSGTTLYSVYWDRVLLNRGDRLETLRLPKEVLGANAAPRARSPVMAPPTAAPPSGNETLRNVISQNAGRLTDIIRLAPNVDQGKVTGFRVQPGRDRQTFDALGLMPGDVVTDINGVVLDDASKGLQAFEALGEATMANVTVLRDGTPQALVIDTTQLQGIRENRQ
jgi:general secretion pathway protein C